MTEIEGVRPVLGFFSRGVPEMELCALAHGHGNETITPAELSVFYRATRGR